MPVNGCGGGGQSAVMRRQATVRLALVALAVPTAALVGACGHSSSHSSASSSSSSSTTTSSSSSGSGNCAAGFVSGKVAGQQKCLQNGQQCQEQDASDYKKYGFDCTKQNGRYELKKK